MNNADDHPLDEGGMSAAYRDLATEESPPELDRRVLQMAKQGAATGTGANWLNARIRPLAFVVTAGLSLALIVQLSNAPTFDIPEPVQPGDEAISQRPGSAFEDAARETAEQIRRLEAESETPVSRDDAGMTPAASSDAAASDSLLPAEDRCTETQRADSGAWWQCIRDLERRGLTQAAEQELRALLEAFPQFSAPQ